MSSRKVVVVAVVCSLLVLGFMYAASRANEPATGRPSKEETVVRRGRTAPEAAGGGGGDAGAASAGDVKYDRGMPLALTEFTDAAIASGDIDRRGDRWKTVLPMPPKAAFEEELAYYWLLDTNQGSMVFKLFASEAPMHASSTVYLTLLGFYDNLIFHRVIQGFMAQGGCPTGTGTSGPGYTYDGEFPAGGRKHDRRGILSMANAGKGTDGSQFFITFVPTPHLDGKHTVFGELVEGEDTLQALEARGSGSGRPSEKLKIIKASVRALPKLERFRRPN